VLRAQDLLAETFGVAADVWSVTSYKELRRDALECERWNRLHPTEKPRRSYIERLLEKEDGIFLAASDYMKVLPDLISRWVPGGITALGTDGFGRSENRTSLRRFFEVDAESITQAALYELSRRGEVKPEEVAKATRDLGINPDKPDPTRV
jgi:pyruvate dehydrogenase E1 component